MFPHPLLMARIGEAVGSMHSEQYAASLENDLVEWKEYAHDLERRLANLTTGYEVMKDILSALSEHSDLVFSAAVTPEQREKLAKLLKMLP